MKYLKPAIRIIIFFALGVGFIWWFISKLSSSELEQLFLSFTNANYFWFAVAVLINILSHYIRAIRWRQLLSPLGYKPKLTPVFLSVMCGYLANLAVPRLGEVARCGLLRTNQKIPFEKAAGTVIIERAVDTILFALILFFAFVFQFDLFKDYIYDNFRDKINFDSLKTFAIYFIIGFSLFVFLILLLRKKISHTKIFIKIKDIILGLLQGMKSILKLENPLLFIFNSLLIWALWILGTYIIFLCLPETMLLSFKIAIIITVFGAIGPIITPGGIGIFPAIIAESLAIYGILKPIGYASGWLMWIVSQIGSLALGLFGFIYFSYKKHHLK